MNRARTYLDWNATAPLRREAQAAMVAALDVVGNPSSPHAEGRRARAIVEDAREQVAALLGARASEVVFTSGGTEGNNAVLAAGWEKILLAGIEHDSVLAPARNSRARLVDLPVDQDGVVVREELSRALASASEGPALLTLQLANNETGVLQPVAGVAAEAKQHGLAVHTDAVQAAGRVPIDVASLGVDYLTVSAHKLGGPQGTGALVFRGRRALSPLISGGGQERRRRAGTESVAAIAGFGAAAQAARRELTQMARVGRLQAWLESQVRSITPEAIIIAEGAARLPNTTDLALPGASAETLVIQFDLAGIAISAGAACASGKVGASHVLAAMGLSAELAGAAIRISLGHGSTQADVARFLDAWTNLAAKRRPRAVA
ncbi:MAG TPA: cysteine desulfurase family protein [Hyphomicrobiaceae bacterium]|nr:cysteine desulfurase family protein [Hyphomicrobiaceae bacterium]